MGAGFFVFYIAILGMGVAGLFMLPAEDVPYWCMFVVFLMLAISVFSIVSTERKRKRGEL